MPPNFKVVNEEEFVTIRVSMTKRVYQTLRKDIWTRAVVDTSTGADLIALGLILLSIENGDPDVLIRYKEEV